MSELFLLWIIFAFIIFNSNKRGVRYGGRQIPFPPKYLIKKYKKNAK